MFFYVIVFAAKYLEYLYELIFEIALASQSRAYWGCLMKKTEGQKSRDIVLLIC
jgi:hypothetical protein